MSKGKIEGLGKGCWGENGRGEKGFPFTFHWPPSLEPSSPPFSSSLKGELGTLGALFLL
jgi:hypothetical protein